MTQFQQSPLPIRPTMQEQLQAGASIPFLVHEAGLPLTCPIQTTYFRFISQEQVRCLQCYFLLCSSLFPLEKARGAGEEGKPLVQWSQEFPIHSTFFICTSLQETQTQIDTFKTLDFHSLAYNSQLGHCFSVNKFTWHYTTK